MINRPGLTWVSLLVLLSTGCMRAAAGEVFAGVDANYSIGMEQEGTKWLWNGKPDDLFEGIARSGVRGFRVRLWTKDDGPHGRDYATQVVQRALAAGLDPYLVIFLSEDWADLMKQPAPAVWKDLGLEQRADAVRDYSRKIVAHFRERGLKSHLYEIGNEIDYGICGVYPGKSTKKTPASLSLACWPQAAKLIKASQEGVLASDPKAKFLLHIAHWWDTKFVIAFFEFMIAQGLRVDFAGLSYFPSANIGGSLEMEQFGATASALHAAVNRPVIVPEVAYPATRDFKGQFSRWKRETPGYPLTPEGQRRWVSDFLDYCAHHPAIHSVYFWSPEWCGEGMWKGFAFFDPDGAARPAWSAFAKARADRPKPKATSYYEWRDGKFHAVPVAEAREKARPVLANKLAKHGRIDIEYIKDITATPLAVGDYDVILHASISGNLDLRLRPEAAGLKDPAKLLEQINPATQRIVVLAAAPADPVLEEAAKAAQARGVEWIIHPTDPEKPLKFGLGGTQSDAVY